jgi:hypothetical protein
LACRVLFSISEKKYKKNKNILSSYDNNNLSNTFRELKVMTVGSKVKQTLAGLKGAESTLRIYSIQSRNEEEKIVYKESLLVLEQITKDIEDRVTKIELEEPQYKGN